MARAANTQVRARRRSVRSSADAMLNESFTLPTANRV